MTLFTSQQLSPWTFRFGASWNLNKTVTCTELELELKLMGISIEQFRSRIGTYDNFLKTKDASSRFKDRSWNIMLMMFYLSVFYLPTLKQVVGQYKIWNEVMFRFTRIICYNVYIPLLMRQANDVEENPGPTIFDVINPMRTVSADYSQGNEALFGENAGKQCVAMSLTAIIYHQIEHVSV